MVDTGNAFCLLWTSQEYCCIGLSLELQRRDTEKILRCLSQLDKSIAFLAMIWQYNSYVFPLFYLHSKELKGTKGENFWKVIRNNAANSTDTSTFAVYAWALKEIECVSCFPQHKIKVDLLLFMIYVFFPLADELNDKAGTNPTRSILARRKLIFLLLFLKICLYWVVCWH